MKNNYDDHEIACERILVPKLEAGRNRLGLSI